MFSNFQAAVAAGNVMRVAMISAMTCRLVGRSIFGYNRISLSRYHQRVTVAPVLALLMEVNLAPVEHVGVLDVCVLSKDFLPLSGLATPVKAWGR